MVRMLNGVINELGNVIVEVEMTVFQLITLNEIYKVSG